MHLEQTVGLAASIRRHKLNRRRWIRVLTRRGCLRARCSSEPSVFLNCQGTVMYFAFDDRRTSQHDAVRLDDVLGALRQAAAYSGSATANEPSGMSRTIAGHCTPRNQMFSHLAAVALPFASLGGRCSAFSGLAFRFGRTASSSRHRSWFAPLAVFSVLTEFSITGGEFIWIDRQA